MRAAIRILPWVVLVGLLLLWLNEQSHRSEAERNAKTAEAVADTLRHRADSLLKVADSLRLAYDVDTVRVHHWTTRWKDAIAPGQVDTMPREELVALADSTIAACLRALSTCEARVAAERARGDVERERGDSLASAATLWRRVARGPWLQPSVELTTSAAWRPELAGAVTLGRGDWRVLVRGELGDSAEVRAGLQWRPR